VPVPALGLHARGHAADADSVGGDHTYEAGQAFYWAPGHAPEALQDCAYVDFSPTAQLQEVLRHIQNAGG
jgi:hypothetical protein